MAYHTFNGWDKGPEDATHFSVQDVRSPWLKVGGEEVYFYAGRGWMPYEVENPAFRRTAEGHLEGAIPKEVAEVAPAPVQPPHPHEFKVGDRVRVICERPARGWGAVRRGDVGVVHRIGLEYLVVTFPAQRFWRGEAGEFELVEGVARAEPVAVKAPKKPVGWW